MKLEANDIEYIAKKIGLDRAKTESLCEEERDINLILNEISKTFDKQESSNISYETYVRLVFFKHSQNKKFDIDEKVYVAKSAFKYLDQLKNKVKLDLLDAKEPTENSSQYFLIASGLFSQKLSPKHLARKNFLKIEDGFRSVGLREVGKHVAEWVDIMRDIQKSGWFKKTK